MIEQVDEVRNCTEVLETININCQDLDLENSLLHRRLNLISDLIYRKQVDGISDLIGQPLRSVAFGVILHCTKQLK